ncbi:MAG TPA: hypothetical protein VFZ64_13835 [Nocardioidaceae bacterium]
MSDMQQQQAPSTAAAAIPQQRGAAAPTDQTGWVGWVVFGAAMMVILGTFHAIAGLVALFNETYFVAPSQDLVVSVSYDTWGWAHLVGGLVVLAVGLGLFTGATWARVLGVVVAMLSAIVNFVFLAAYPVWSIMMIALAVLVVYAIAAHGAEIKNEGP